MVAGRTAVPVSHGGCAQNARPFFRGLGPSVLPYRPHSLHWDAAGTSNREGVYCYCGHARHSGHDRWPMIQCSACSQFFHGGMCCVAAYRCIAVAHGWLVLLPCHPRLHCHCGARQRAVGRYGVRFLVQRVRRWL